MRVLTFRVFLILLISLLWGCPGPVAKLAPPEPSYVWADSVLSSLNLESKVGQMIMIDVASVGDITNSDDRSRFMQQMMQGRVGGLVLFAGQPMDYAPWIEWAHSQSEVPPFVALDAEWGAGFRLEGFTRFPNAMAIAASGDPSLAHHIGEETARQAKSIGISVLFAPVVDVQTNPKNPVIGTRAWSDNPDSVATYAKAFARGVRAEGLMPVAKHFPGHGDTSTDSHTDLPVSERSEAEFFEQDLKPFQELMADSLEAIMSAHIITRGHSFSDEVPSTLSSRVLQELARDSLKFEGLIFSDALNMAGVSTQGTSAEVAVNAVKAGIDVLLMPPDAIGALRAIVEAVRNGEISESRIDSSVRRILHAKEDLRFNRRETITDLAAAIEYSTSKRTSDEAWFAARQAVTLLKNDDILPLSLANQPITLFTADFKTYQDVLSAPANRMLAALLDRSESPVQLIEIDPRDWESSLDSSLKTADPRSTFIFADFIGITPVTRWRRSQFLEQLALPGNPIIVADMASPFVITKTPQSIAAHILGYDSSQGMSKAVADLIFGLIAAKGHLPVHVSDAYPRGFGLSSTQTLPSRVPAQQAHMDQSSLLPLDRLLQHAVDDHAFPAAALVVGRGNNIVKRNDFGRFTYETDRFLAEEDVFDLASLTKVIATTTVIMKLVEEDKIDLFRPVADYLPEFAAEGKGAVTIWDLLTHTGGLIPFRPFYAQGVRTGKELRSRILNDSLIYEPGTQSSYSDFGPITLAWMIERIT